MAAEAAPEAETARGTNRQVHQIRAITFPGAADAREFEPKAKGKHQTGEEGH